MFLALLCWIIVGLIAGGIAARVVNLQGDDPRLGLFVGAVAATVGGIAFRLISQTSTSGPGLWSLFIAAGTAGIGLTVWHVIRKSAQT